LHYAATKEDALRAGDELSNPVQLAATTDSALLVASSQRGAETYRVFCIVCHGAAGNGDGPVAQKGYPPPPSLLTGNSRLMKDGQIFHLLTYGQANMPAFAGQISREQRWDLVNYIRTLQPPAASPDSPVVVPDAETPQPAIEVTSESE
jgi:mono/diheme cytochrome c family protein